MDALIDVLGTFFTIYGLCILAWVVLSWLPMVSPALAYNSTISTIRRFLDSVVLPWVRLFRFIPPVRAGGMMLDLSSLVAIVVFSIGSSMIMNVLRGV